MDKGKTLRLIKIILISAGAAATYASLEHFGASPSCLIISGNFDVSCWVQDVQARVFGTLGQPNWLAAYLVSLAPLAWSQALRKKSTIYIILSALLFTTLLFTKSRSGLLGFAVAFSIFWPAAFYLHKKNIKKILTIFIFITSFVILVFTIEGVPARHASQGDAGGTESGDIRRIVWGGAFDLWKKYPLLGTGVETFAYSYYETRPSAHNLTSEWNFVYNKAHNEYLNFAATTGTVGLASYLILIFASLKIFIKKIDALKAALLSGYVSILVTNFFGFSTVTTALFFFIFPAMAQGIEQESERVKEYKFKKIKITQAILISISCSLALLLFYSSVRYWLADYYYAQGDIPKAVSLAPNEPLYRLELAQTYGSLGNTALAEEELNFVLKTSPRNIKLLKMTASAYGDLGETDQKNYQKEQEVLKLIITLAPTDPQPVYNLALSYAKSGNRKETIKLLRKVLNLKPDYEKARELLGRLL